MDARTRCNSPWKAPPLTPLSGIQDRDCAAQGVSEPSLKSEYIPSESMTDLAFDTCLSPIFKIRSLKQSLDHFDIGQGDSLIGLRIESNPCLPDPLHSVDPLIN